jgi:hypothetical protein
MKIKNIIPLSFVLVAIAAGERTHELPEAKVTILAVDELHQPVAEVNVWLGFKDQHTMKDVNVRGQTDTKGLFSAEGGSDTVVGAMLTKGGYYWSSAPIPVFREVDKEKNCWLPWNPTVETVLRKTEKPVPVYGKAALIDIPATNVPCGYDLKAGDWIAPYGEGKTADFVMILDRQYENRNKFDVSVVLSFSNARDGIQETKLPEEYRYSAFKWPRSAPDTGYKTAFTTELEATLGKDYKSAASEDQNYFFRVRTVEQDGKIVSALYGKIRGGFQLDPMNSKTCLVKLAYYLNPTPLDRNMEFDLQRNMLTNAGQFENLREP